MIPTPGSSTEHRPEVAVVLHGAGSTGAVAATLLPATALGVDEVVAPDLPGGAQAAAAALARCVAEQRERGRRARWVGGISLGAHAAARWAAGNPADAAALDGLLLVMPAWTGSAGAVAALTAAAADDVARHGRAGVLARLHDDPTLRGDWVLEALAAGWRAYPDDETLVAALRAAATSPAPTPLDLAGVLSPCGVVALADDPLHPEAVAREWAAALPRSELAVVDRRDPSAGRGALAVAAVAAAQAAAQPCS